MRNMSPLRPNFKEAMTYIFLLQSDILFCASVLLFGLTSLSSESKEMTHITK